LAPQLESLDLTGTLSDESDLLSVGRFFKLTELDLRDIRQPRRPAPFGGFHCGLSANAVRALLVLPMGQLKKLYLDVYKPEAKLLERFAQVGELALYISMTGPDASLFLPRLCNITTLWLEDTDDTDELNLARHWQNISDSDFSAVAGLPHLTELRL